MTGLMGVCGYLETPRSEIFASPAYYVFQMYSAAKGDTVLPVVTNSGTYSVKNGTAGFPSVSGVPYIDIAATRSTEKRTLTLFCINRSLTDDAPVAIDIGTFASTGTAHVEQIYAVSRYVMNDEVEPQRVVPRDSSIAIIPGHPLATILPHESLHRHTPSRKVVLQRGTGPERSVGTQRR